MRFISTVGAVFLAAVLSAATTDQTLGAGTADKTLNDQHGNPFMEEVAPTADSEARSWQALYWAYSCVHHHNYTLATRWLNYALSQGAGTPMLKARGNAGYLARGLNSVAVKRKEAAVSESSCDALVLQALIQEIVDDQEESVDSLKRVVLNYPKDPSVEFLKRKIRAMEFNLSGCTWMEPPDVAQTGGNPNRFSRWRADALPLKVYIPTDAAASKTKGYRAGDCQLLRTAFETWQRKSGGKIRFVYVPTKSRSDIACAWVSDQKELVIKDAIGMTTRFADGLNYLIHADVQVLTFAMARVAASGTSDQFRKNYIEETCLHEIGHSLGLNHSSSKNDVMWAYAHWHPITDPTSRDVSALESLYLTNVHGYISAALDALESKQYKSALKSLEQALATNPRDAQTRRTICICFKNTGLEALDQSDFQTAIKLLTKANELMSGTESAKVKEDVLKGLHYAYLQSGQTKEAEALENQNAQLLPATKDSASFLDQYGLKRESVPYYEQALAAHPDDKAIREKFCFLLVMLARDEMNNDNDQEALSLLTRAKGLLVRGMPESIIHKVLSTTSQVYLKEERFEEADQVGKDVPELLKDPEKTAEEAAASDMELLVLGAKRKHPSDWANPTLEKAQRAKLHEAYEQYFNALQQCVLALHAEGRPGWAQAFLIRHKQYDGRKDGGTIARIFELRHRLIDLSEAGAVFSLDCLMTFKNGVASEKQ